MAEQEDQSSKTEQPTDRKLSKAREQGNVPKSKEINHLFALAGLALLLITALPYWLKKTLDIMGTAFNNLDSYRLDSVDNIGEAMQTLGQVGLGALLPIMLIMMIFGLAGGLIQNGIIFTSKQIEPKLDKISLIKGLKRMFSIKSLAEFLKTLFKLAIVGFALYLVIQFHWQEILQLNQQTPFDLANTVFVIFLRLVLAAIAIMAMMGILDYLFQRQQFMEEQKMSRREIKDEMKESEGDPYIRQRQRQIRQQRAQQRMMSEVPKADVVITNPTHFAVALQYDPDGERAAPLVCAKGADYLALKIRELAAEHNVPLYEDPPLARQLYRDVEIDQEVPVQMYQAVAKVVAYVLDLKNKKRS